MSLKQQTKEQYEAIRQSVMKDPELTDDTERLQKFSNTYKGIILAEPAIMEWETDYWDVQTRVEGLTMLFCTVLLGILAAFSSDFLVVALGLGLFMLFINAMLTYPTRYKHKLTESGVYVYRYKRGKKIRQFLAGFLLLITVIAGIVLTFYMGLMAFAGAGAGMLGIFTFYALIQKQDKVKEAALPWQGIYLVAAYSENKFMRKDRYFRFHQLHTRCSINNYERVREIVKSKLREDGAYAENDYELYSDEIREVLKRRLTELPFYEGELYG